MAHLKVLSRAVGFASLVLVISPVPAWAHGLSRNAVELDTAGFFRLGVEHMLLGWDHLLFIAGVLLISDSWKTAAKLITLFVIGHSVTLLAAVNAGGTVSAATVDAIIALSVLFVATVLVTRFEVKPMAMAVMVTVFGLIHGLGLATRFNELGLSEDGLMGKVAVFNVGIEVGQLIAIAAMSAVGWALTRGKGKAALLDWWPTFGGVLAVGGVAALGLSLFNLLVPQVGAPTEFEPAADSTCVVRTVTDSIDVGATSSGEGFYEQSVSQGQIGHALSDGYLIVWYPESYDDSMRQPLRDYAATDLGKGVIFAPHTDDTIRLRTYHETMTCDGWEESTITDFANTWFDTL